MNLTHEIASAYIDAIDIKNFFTVNQLGDTPIANDGTEVTLNMCIESIIDTLEAVEQEREI